MTLHFEFSFSEDIKTIRKIFRTFKRMRTTDLQISFNPNLDNSPSIYISGSDKSIQMLSLFICEGHHRR